MVEESGGDRCFLLLTEHLLPVKPVVIRLQLPTAARYLFAGALPTHKVEHLFVCQIFVLDAFHFITPSIVCGV